MEEPALPLNSESGVTFIGKDDGLEKRVSLFIEGKHGRIGIIRSDKAASQHDKQEFIDALAKVICHSIRSEKETRDE